MYLKNLGALGVLGGEKQDKMNHREHRGSILDSDSIIGQSRGQRVIRIGRRPTVLSFDIVGKQGV